MMTDSGWFLTAAAGIGASFLLYPLLLALITGISHRVTTIPARDKPLVDDQTAESALPMVQVIAVGYAPGHLLRPKIENTLALDYPEDKLSLFLGFDGPIDNESKLEPLLADPRVRVMDGSERLGKCLTINRVMSRITADILVFTDMDALLAPDVIRRLVNRFTDPGVGGVCGRRVIAESDGGFTPAQADYIDYDSRLKALEEHALGSITSNDGKLYAMRRHLFRPLPPAVTDDLYNGLSVILGGARLVFEAQAIALIRKPSRGGFHEIKRRRRIVCRSLAGIFARPVLFLPWRFRGYGLALFINKVNRRLLPLYLLVMLMSCAVGAGKSMFLAACFGLQVAFYGIALGYGALGTNADHLPGFARRIGGVTYYFLVGNVGMLLGWWDFFSGKRPAVWEPNKGPGAAAEVEKGRTAGSS